MTKQEYAAANLQPRTLNAVEIARQAELANKYIRCPHNCTFLYWLGYTYTFDYAGRERHGEIVKLNHKMNTITIESPDGEYRQFNVAKITNSRQW